MWRGFDENLIGVPSSLDQYRRWENLEVCRLVNSPNEPANTPWLARALRKLLPGKKPAGDDGQQVAC